MTQIGKVSAVFTASTSGLLRGVEAAGRAFKTLGGDSAALRSALSSLDSVSRQGFLEIGPIANNARAAFVEIATEAGRLRQELSAGAVSSGEFALQMAELTREAQQTARAFADAAAIRRDNASAESTYFKELDRVSEAVRVGGLEEQFATAARDQAWQSYIRNTAAIEQQAAALARLSDAGQQAVDAAGVEFTGMADAFAADAAAALGLSEATGAAAEALRQAAAASEVARIAEEQRAEMVARSAQIAQGVASAEERHAAAIRELDVLYGSGVLSIETYNAAVAQQDNILATANGSIAAARAAMQDLAEVHQRGATVTRANMTAQERYADEIAGLNSLLQAGAINQETFNRASQAAADRMRRAGDGAQEMGRGLDGVNNRLNALIAIDVVRFFAGIVTTITNTARSFANYGNAQAQVVEQTDKLAQRLGVTYGEMAGLAQAGALANVSLDQIGAAAGRADAAFVRAARGSQQAQAVFANLGLDLQQLGRLNTADRFEEIGAAIAALPTEAERAAAATQLFGRQGAQLLPLFNEGAEGIARARQEAEAFGLALTNAQATDVRAMNDSFVRAQSAISGVVQQVVAFLSPAVTAVVEQFNAFIANIGGANIGQAIGEGILVGAEFLAGVGDWFIENFSGTFQFLSQVGQQLGGVFGFLNRTVSFLSGVFNSAKAIFLTIVQAFSATFLGLSTIAQQIGQFLGFDTSSIDAIVAGAQAFDDEISNGITQAVNDAARDFGNAFATDAAPVGQAVAGPLVTALRNARQTARDSADDIDEAKKAPVAIEQTVEVKGITEALKAVDSRSAAGVSEMFRLMRGGTGDVQEQQLGVLEEIRDGLAGDDDVYPFALAGG